MSGHGGFLPQSIHQARLTMMSLAARVSLAQEPEPEENTTGVTATKSMPAFEKVLQELQTRAEQLNYDYGISSRNVAVEAVEPTAHQRLLAGEFTDWKVAQPSEGWQGESSDNAFAPSTPASLLADHGQGLGEIMITGRGSHDSLLGKVWKAAHTHERGYKRWMHTWYVVECGSRAVRIHEYNFDKG